MDYKKKYEEVLEKAKQWHKDGYGHGCQELMEDLFPELKESEGEKTKRLLHTIANKMGQHLRDIFTEEEFQCYDAWSNAYLEKQSEPTEINPSEFDSQLNRLLGQFKSLPKEELASSLSFYLNVVQNDGTYKEEKQGEQKPDKNKGMNLVEEEMTPFQKEVFCIIDTTIEEEQGLKQVCDKLFALASNEIKQKFSWSEEDEKILSDIIKDLVHPWNEYIPDRIEDEIKWLKNKLKSLRPQNRWKPSDEMLEALYRVIPENVMEKSENEILLDKLYQGLKYGRVLSKE